MNRKMLSSTTQRSGGRFASADLDQAFDQTVDSHPIDLEDLMTAGWTVEELAKALATTPPFSEALVMRVRQYLLTIH